MADEKAFAAALLGSSMTEREEFRKVLEDVQAIRARNPARFVAVPAVFVEHEIERFLSPLAKRASINDGCTIYVIVGGKRYRMTLEAL